MDRLLVSSACSDCSQFEHHLIVGGFDYDSRSYIITIPATLTNASFDIAIYNNNILEANENFSLMINTSLADSGNVTIGNIYQATVTIFDDDGKLHSSVELILKVAIIFTEYVNNNFLCVLHI